MSTFKKLLNQKEKETIISMFTMRANEYIEKV